MNLRETYDRIAQVWNEEHRRDDWWHAVSDEFISYLPAGAQVLDVGCGTGFAAERLAAHGMRVTGIDFSEGQLGIARARVPGAKFMQLRIEDLDSLSDTYDGIFFQAALLHFPKSEAQEIVNTCVARMKEGGYIYVSVKKVRDDRPEETMVTDEIEGESFERFFSYFTLEELEGYLNRAGITVISKSENPTGRAVWLQIIGKK